MNFPRAANSIIVRLLLLGVIIVLAGTAVRYVVLTNFLREDVGAVVASQQHALASYVAHDIDQKIVERERFLQRMSSSLPVELLGRPEELRAWLRHHHELMPLFSYGMFVAAPTGRTIADYPARPERDTIDYSGRDYFRSALTGTAYIGKPVLGLAAREPVLPMAVPVADAQGKVRAVLVGVTTLAAPGFLDLLQTSHIGETGGFLLVSPRDRIFVAADDPDMTLKPTPPEGVNPLHDRAMAGYRGTGITVNAKGVEEISAMASVPSTGWFVVARLPTSEAFSTVTRAQRFVLRNSAPVIAIFLFVAWVGMYYTFRPLMKAADHADRMTCGEIPLAPLPVARNDEVGHLTEAFNRLLAKLADSQAELNRMAHHDPLTGLPNRLLLSDRLQQALERASRNGTELAVLCLDLDGFKPINDARGHDAGDEALRQVAQRLADAVRGSDTLARVGGDEFVILLADIDNGDAHNAARTVAEKCIGAMAHPFAVRETICSLGVSIGIVTGNGFSTAHELVADADRAMYKAKEAGRGRYHFGSSPAFVPDGRAVS